MGGVLEHGHLPVCGFLGLVWIFPCLSPLYFSLSLLSRDSVCGCFFSLAHDMIPFPCFFVYDVRVYGVYMPVR